MNDTTHATLNDRTNRWRAAAWSLAAILMILPLVAGLVTDKVAWDAGDFLLLGVLLAAVLGVVELAVRRSSHPAFRAAVVVAAAAGFLLVVVNLAVGIIGSEGDPANLMFAGVLAVACGGTVLARFRARGLARAMVIAAAAQVLVGAVALVLGLGSGGPVWPVDILGATAFFTALWGTAAWLFRRSATEKAR